MNLRTSSPRPARGRALAPLAALAMAFTLAVAAPAPAQAGRSCERTVPTVGTMQRGFALAESTAQALDRSGATVAVLARAGQDLRKYGLDWSHIGLAYRTDPGPGGPGVWRVVHKLNACGKTTAGVYRQGLLEFFTDDPYRHEAAMMVLEPHVAERLRTLLVDDRRVAALHEPAYSVVAYPWAQRYQQSNQWAIETLAYALEPGATTRQRAQAWLMLQGYVPTTLHLGAFERMGARMTRANAAFDDHPGDKRWSDRIETVTADSVFAWLSRSGLGRPLVVIR